MNAQTKVTAATTPAVYERIAAVQSALSKEGISKDRSNTQQKYKFRGIDDVYNALAPVLAEHGLCILPRMLSREVVERKSSSGNALFYVTVEAEFDFIAAVDGSCHVIRTFGEAMDSADKATNKAMSAAYKYAAFMAFAIPTEGDNDADAATHQVAPREVAKPKDEGGMPDAEWSRLVQLAKASGTTSQELAKKFGVENLRAINQSQYAEAVELMNARLAEKAKADTNNSFGELVDDEIPY